MVEIHTKINDPSSRSLVFGRTDRRTLVGPTSVKTSKNLTFSTKSQCCATGKSTVPAECALFQRHWVVCNVRRPVVDIVRGVQVCVITILGYCDFADFLLKNSSRKTDMLY